MTTTDGRPAMARSSLLAITKLARLLHRVGHRLRPVKDQSAIKPLARRVTDQEFEPQMRRAMDQHAQPLRPRHKEISPPSGVLTHQDATPPATISEKVQELNDCTALRHVSLLSLASNDDLLLQHHHYHLPVTKNVTSLRRIVDACNVLLASLAHISFQEEPPGPNKYVVENVTQPKFLSTNVEGEKFLANLEYLLLWFRQCALDAILSYFLVLVEKAVVHFFQHSLMKKGALYDWFSEWPNGQRPLSTTWPWNIKPSLIVLWGVCWMFYNPQEHQASQAQGNPYSTADQFGQDIWLGQAAAQAQAQQQADSSVPTGGPGPSYANYSLLHPYQANASLRRASEGTRTVLPPGSSVATSSSLTTSASTFPYINVSSDEHSALFSTPSFDIWPYSSGINPSSVPAFDPNTTFWQEPNVSNVQQNLIASPSYQTYVVQPINQATTPHTTSAGQQALSVAPPGFRAINAQTARRNMQDYPSPQLSDVSGQGDPSYAAFHTKMMASPSAASLLKSPSASGSSSSLRTIERFREPQRDAQGAYICDDLSCAHDPPTFVRKCEWTKHMDKHTRPYICEEPGCENLRGFTYLGGLLRHQREVHRRHGGPRAACFCPHQDCKRSTGVGFSRKENLAEHLRRVHRDGAAQASAASQEMEQRPSSQTLPAAGTRKRRRKATAAEESEEEEGPSSHSQNSQCLRQEVKKLKRELKEKDERLRRLEEQVQRLAGR